MGELEAGMKQYGNWGFVLLAIWLIIEGVLRLTSASALGIIMGLLALAAGILLLVANVRGVKL
jgi:uncharacterized membrane protein HdeD (DUF308 family)